MTESVMVNLKLWLYAIGAAVFAALGLTSVYFKGKAKRVSAERDTLKATVHAERVRKKIEKKEKRVLEENERKIKEEVKKKDEKEFKGIDNLTNPNDW